MGSKPALAMTTFLLLCGALAAAAQEAPTGSWADETTDYWYVGTDGVTDGAFLYIAGRQVLPGIDAGPISWGSLRAEYSYFRRYDPAGNTWTTLAPRPYPNHSHAAGCYGGRVFLLGGLNYDAGAISSAILAYDIATNSWSILNATLTTPRVFCSAAAIGERIFVTGGHGANNSYFDVNDEFNAANETVTARAPLPGAITVHRSCAVPALNRIYVMTGSNNNSIYSIGLSVNWEYALPSALYPDGRWTVRAPVQDGSGQLLPRWLPHGFVLNNRVYLAGGLIYIGGGTLGLNGTTLEYNPFTDAWAQRADLPVPRAGGAGVTIGNKGYVYSVVNGYEFTPPDHGSPPDAPTSVMQIGTQPESSLQAQSDPDLKDGWTHSWEITFSAHVTDPDPGQPIRWLVQVKPAELDWSEQSALITTLDSGPTDQGTITVTYAVTHDGSYDWRWRVEDSNGDPYPLVLKSDDAGWIEAFGNANSPDFRMGPAESLSWVPIAAGGGHDDRGRCSSSSSPTRGSLGMSAVGMALLAAAVFVRLIRT